MASIKRQLSNNFNYVDDCKKQKAQIIAHQTDWQTEERISHFEDLSNELLYEIFDYLDYFHVYQAFFNLNQRFCNILTHSNLPIKINLSSMSRTTFTRYNQDIIQSNIHRITSLHISDVFMYDLAFPLVYNLIQFDRINTLICNNIESKYIEILLNQLYSLSLLSSLVISSIDDVKNKNLIYRQVFGLRTLKYCKLSLPGWNIETPIEMCTNEGSSIEHLVITNGLLCDELYSLLSYVPHLRYLSIGSLIGSWTQSDRVLSNPLNDLTHLSLKIYSLKFDYLIQLMKDFFRNIQVLHFTIQSFSKENTYIDANKWEQLITDHLPNLRIFDISINTFIVNSDEQLRIQTQINQFNTPFWIERQWFFTYKITSSKQFVFYSTNPYRRKYYTLYRQVDKTISMEKCQLNLNSVKYVTILNDESLIHCNEYFPNASQLTFHGVISLTDNSITKILSRILPLKQLTKLTIKCNPVFSDVMNILRYAPNIHTVELNTIDYSGKEIEQNEDFQFVSQTNIVRNITCTAEITLEQIQLLVGLCPQMQSFSMNATIKDLEPIVRFLLDKNNKNTRHLSSLHFSNCYTNRFEKVNTLIKSETLLEDYTSINIYGYSYICW